MWMWTSQGCVLVLQTWQQTLASKNPIMMCFKGFGLLKKKLTTSAKVALSKVQVVVNHFANVGYTTQWRSCLNAWITSLVKILLDGKLIVGQHSHKTNFCNQTHSIAFSCKKPLITNNITSSKNHYWVSWLSRNGLNSKKYPKKKLANTLSHLVVSSWLKKKKPWKRGCSFFPNLLNTTTWSCLTCFIMVDIVGLDSLGDHLNYLN